MRLFKSTRKPDIVLPPDAAVPKASEMSDADIIDVDLVLKQVDSQAQERDDAAPVGTYRANDTSVTDVPVKNEPPDGAARKAQGMFGRFARRSPHSDGAGKTEPPSVERKKAGPLDWGTAAATLASSAPHAEPTARVSVGAPLTGSEDAEHSAGTLSASQETAYSSSESAGYVPAEAPVRKSRFESIRSRMAKSGSSDGEVHEAPIRVLVGFLPEVSEKDALEYAMGVAAKHFDNLGIAFYDAFKADNGYAYEAHEGGGGRAYLPEVLKYYKSLGAFNPEDDNKVVVRTGTRAVEISRARSGLSAVLLPEDSKPNMPAWLKPTVAMRPAINKRTGLLVVGAALFVSGFIAAISSGFIFRLQPYEAPVPVKLEQVSYFRLPASQWSRLQSEASTAGKYVTALRFEKGQWRVDTETPNATPSAQTPPAVPPVAAAPSAAPATSEQ